MKQVIPPQIDRLPRAWSVAVRVILTAEAALLVGAWLASTRRTDLIFGQALVLGLFALLMFLAREPVDASRKGSTALLNAVAFLLGGGFWGSLVWHADVRGGVGWLDPITWSTLIYAVSTPVLLLHRPAQLVVFCVGELAMLGIGLAHSAVAPFASAWLYVFCASRTAVAAVMALGTARDVNPVTARTSTMEGGAVAGVSSARNVDEISRARAFAEVADGLRGPVHALMRVAQVLVSAPDSSERRPVAQVQEAAAAMAGAVNALKEIAMVDVDRRQLRLQKTPVRTVALRVSTALSARAKRKGLTLSVEVDDAWVLTDAGSLHSILLILVSNALQYTDAGWVRIRSCLSEESLELIVQDSGRGVAPSEHHRIFEPFVRGANVREEDFGSGLGLTLASLLAKKADLVLKVESAIGEGASFSLRLPLSAPRIETFVATTVGLPASSSSLVGARALVIVANRELCTQLQHDLQAWGMVVRSAASVYEMMNVLLEGYRPDLLVVSPPLEGGATGRDVLASLRSLVQVATTPMVIIQPADELPIRIRKSDLGIRSVRLDARLSSRLKSAMVDLLVAPDPVSGRPPGAGSTDGGGALRAKSLPVQRSVDVT